MTSMSAKALRTDPRGLAFLQAVLHTPPRPTAPCEPREPVHKPIDPDERPTAKRCVAAGA
jgi:hypothetical protein